IVLSDKLAYKTQEPMRWDTAIVKHPGYEYKMLKRIVGMPGEEIEIAGGNVWINDKPLVRPQNVLLSQMHKTPISFINFEKRFADDPSKHKNVRMQFGANATGQYKENWSSVLGENIGTQRNPQTQPLKNDEMLEEFKLWWFPECIGQLSSNFFRMLPLKNQKTKSFSMLLDSAPLTDVNSIKTLTDDIALQLDAVFHNPQNLNIFCISESIEEVAAYTFEIDFTASEIKITALMKDKLRQKSLGKYERTFKLREIADRNQILIQTIDGIPAAVINNQVYTPKFKPLSVFYKLERYQLGLSFQMDSADIYSIGLFTPTFYYPKGVLKSGERLAIPEDCYFVLGDNSSFSQDSRDFEILNVEFVDGTKKMIPRSPKILENVESQWHTYYPFVRRDDILSRAFAVYKPIELARFIK
ncbi:MAG: S26 family signal peptidase, partial [Planctomycetes bacterium]|nr:S26 family signal peptidase [Planctomycetota bacterium]